MTRLEWFELQEKNGMAMMAMQLGILSVPTYMKYPNYKLYLHYRSLNFGHMESINKVSEDTGESPENIYKAFSFFVK
jgi:hypothetical protein